MYIIIVETAKSKYLVMKTGLVGISRILIDIKQPLILDIIKKDSIQNH